VFKVGDRVVANGFVVTGNKESMCQLAKEYETNKTVLTIFNESGCGFLAGLHEMYGKMFYYDKSELRYATDEEIKEADRVVKLLIKKNVPEDKEAVDTAKLIEALYNDMFKDTPDYIKEMKKWSEMAEKMAKEGKSFRVPGPIHNFGVGLSSLLGIGQPFDAMVSPAIDYGSFFANRDCPIRRDGPGLSAMYVSPETLEIETKYDDDDCIAISNDREHVAVTGSDNDDSFNIFLEPQEARDTAKALCEHADYVEKMREKAKPSALKDADIKIDRTSDRVVLNVMGCHSLLTPVDAMVVADGLKHNAAQVLERQKPKQPVFKIWKEGVKDEEGVVWLKLIKGMLSGDIILSVTNHLDTHRIEILRITAAQGVLVRNAIQIDGIQTDSEGRIKEAE
jgi:hypothetical protein